MSSVNESMSCHGQPAAAPTGAPLTVEEIRRRLSEQKGPRYWRSLEEIAEAPEFTELLHREFPRQASELTDGVSRREFLQLAAASLALAGLTACTRNPLEKIVPYVKNPEGILPGQSLYYATALTRGGVATGALVESTMGRPIKIEGNDRHPASLGASSAAMQAALLTMYDPDRSQVVINLDEVRPWSSFVTAMQDAMAVQKGKQGAGVRILTETVTSPTLASQLESLLAAYPGARWHQWEPIHRDNALAGARLAYGRDLSTRCDLSAARVIVSFDDDFLFEGPGHLRYIRDFTQGRRVRTPAPAHGPAGEAGAAHGSGPRHPAEPWSQEMNRLYVVETTFTNTGSRADHRLGVSPAGLESVVREVARQLGVAGVAPGARLDARQSRVVTALVADLRGAAGVSAVMVGDSAPPVVHALGHAINEALGNVGRAVIHAEPIVARPEPLADSLAALCADMERGAVELLVIVGGNPVYTAPAGLDFARKLDKVALRAHLGLYEDETSELCHWHVPEAHPLEAWSDARAFDGTASIVQPLIAPLYEGKTAHEFVAAFSAEPGLTGHEILRARWKKAHPGLDFEAWWNRALHDGLIEGSAAAGLTPALQNPAGWAGVASAPAADGPTLIFRADPCVGDGADANNGWLQELPKPLTHLTWENAALVSPKLAERLGLVNGDVVEIAVGAARVTGPAWILPGQPENAVTVHFGYGRRKSGRVGNGIGFDAYRLRASGSDWTAAGAGLKKTGRRIKMACTQDHSSMEGRHLIRYAGLPEHTKNPGWARELGHHEPPRDLTLYPEWPYKGNAWGLAIDLTACIGCNACVIACQAENNIPVVGTEPGGQRPRDALDPDRPLLRGRARRSDAALPAGDLPAVRKRPVRGRLPGGGHRPQPAKA